MLETFAGLRTSIVAGGVFSILGTAVLSFALPAFWRYDAREGEKLRRLPT